MNDKKKSGFASAGLLALCGLFAAGCASIPMKRTQMIADPTPETVLVSFVRQAMIAGDTIMIGYARVAWGVAAATDERIPKWRTLKAMAPVDARRARFETRERERREVLKAIKEFKDDSVKSYAEIKPENAL